MWVRFVCAALLLLGGAGVANGEKPRPRIPIEVRGAAEDMVGGRLVYHVKEALRGARGFCDPEPDFCHVTLVLTTMDRHKGEGTMENLCTVYAAIWLVTTTEPGMPDHYITSTVGSCGSDRVKSSAESLVAETDRLFGDWEWLKR